MEILSGVFAGISYATAGYIRAASKGEEFELKKFIKAVIIGACVGLISTALRVPHQQAEAILGQVGATALIDKLASAIYEKISKI